VPLKNKNRSVGVVAQATYTADVATVPPGSMLYVFSDGVFEIIDKAGVDWSLDDFVPLLLQPPVAGIEESRRLLDLVRQHAREPEFDDDFTLMAFKFPSRAEQQ